MRVILAIVVLVLAPRAVWAYSPCYLGPPEPEYLKTVERRPSTGGAWQAASSLTEARSNPVAVLLPSGEVLVVGPQRSAERYDPSTDAWRPAAAPLVERVPPYPASATVLQSGEVLLVGGGTASTERYDPDADAWQLAAPLSTRRDGQTATLLASGLVLVVGGISVDSAELYDPASDSWTDAGHLSGPRTSHQAVLLESGAVLVVGGWDGTSLLATAEIYDPVSNTWSATGSLSRARSQFQAVRLASGKALAIGGTGEVSTEIYDPEKGTWSGSAPTSVQAVFTATLLPTGDVLAIGGLATELFDVAAGSWVSSDSLREVRYQHSTTLLADGGLLVAGGWSWPPPPEDRPTWIDPGEATVEAGRSVTFQCSCGGGYACSWSLDENNSGGRIDAAGKYVAGRRGGVTDVVGVKGECSWCQHSTASVFVTPSSSQGGGCASATSAGSVLALLALLSWSWRRRYVRRT